jgi:hypothetical protein
MRRSSRNVVAANASVGDVDGEEDRSQAVELTFGPLSGKRLFPGVRLRSNSAIPLVQIRACLDAINSSLKIERSFAIALLLWVGADYGVLVQSSGKAELGEQTRVR